jgi:hypothetical protein
MWQIYEVKVIVLTWGGLALNCKKSAEAIVLLWKCARKKEQGLTAICHKAKRRIHKEACYPKRFAGNTWNLQEGLNNGSSQMKGR